MFNQCTCVILDAPVDDIPCEFCATMIWAAELEAKIKALPTHEDLEDAKMDRSEIEDAVDDVLKDSYVKEEDLETEFERYIKDIDLVDREDLNDYVLDSELEEKISEALNDTDLVRDVASGAAEGAMRNLNRYATKQEVVDIALETLKTAIQNMPFWTRLRLLFGWSA